MPENARCPPGGNRTISGADTSTTSTASTTKSATRSRRKLRLLCRSQNWTAVLQRATGKPAGSIFIFNFAAADFAMANELELMATYIIWKMVVISVSWKEFQKIDGECRQYTHKHCTHSAVQTLHKRNASDTLGSIFAESSLCAWKESVIWSAHVSPFVALSPAVHHEHIFFLIHSSFYHDTRTRTTIGTTRSIYSKNTQCIINLSKNDQSKSNAIKNRSGVKTSRVAETRATHSPQLAERQRHGPLHLPIADGVLPACSVVDVRKDTGSARKEISWHREFDWTTCLSGLLTTCWWCSRSEKKSRERCRQLRSQKRWPAETPVKIIIKCLEAWVWRGPCLWHTVT